MASPRASIPETLGTSAVFARGALALLAIGASMGRSPAQSITRIAPIPAQWKLWGSCFLDAQKGFVCGERMSLYRTLDGGGTWSQVALSGFPDQPLYDVKFLDANVGIVCGNSSPSGAQSGCLNSIALGGRVSATGRPELAAGTVVLHGDRMPNSSALYMQGTSQLANGAGIVFGDGVRGVGGSIVRLGATSNAAGSSACPVGGQPSVSVRGLVSAPGVRTYQVSYRNAASSCTASTFNLTNGCLITWTP